MGCVLAYIAGYDPVPVAFGRTPGDYERRRSSRVEGAALFGYMLTRGCTVPTILTMLCDKGWFQTTVTAGNFHEFNLRDKVIASLLIEKLRRSGGQLGKDDFVAIPFDDLRVQ